MALRLAPLAAALAGALVAVAAAQVAAQGAKSDWERELEERNWKERELALPPYFKEGELIEFYVAGTTSFRFYVDPASISVGADGVVRYTLVARSAQGAENVTYEGIRCAARTYRIYAAGRPERTWKAVESDWQPTDRLWTRVLRREYFCPLEGTIHTAAEGVDALRRGGNADRHKFGGERYDGRR